MLGGIFGRGALRRRRFSCLLTSPTHLPQQILCPSLLGNSCCPQLSLPAPHPLPPLPLPPHPLPDTLLSLLKGLAGLLELPFQPGVPISWSCSTCLRGVTAPRVTHTTAPSPPGL